MRKILNSLLASFLLFVFILHSCSKSGPFEVRPDGVSTYFPNSTGSTTAAVSNCTFWVKDPYGSEEDIYTQVPSGILNLTVGGETKTLYYYYNESGPAACGIVGTLNVTLPFGFHTWTATSLNGSRSISGSVFISAAGCSIKQIVW